MTRRPRSIEESLGTFARVRVKVSVEDRVMAAVRVEAARRRALSLVTPRQKAVLGGAAAFGLLAEAAAWVGIAALLSPGLRLLAGMYARPWGAAAYELARPLLSMLPPALRLAASLGRAFEAVASALLAAAPSPLAVAALFVSLVVSLTFFTVRRDLQRSPATARGLR